MGKGSHEEEKAEVAAAAAAAEEEEEKEASERMHLHSLTRYTLYCVKKGRTEGRWSARKSGERGGKEEDSGQRYMRVGGPIVKSRLFSSSGPCPPPRRQAPVYTAIQGR
jgi:hypothetical protein